MNSKSGACGVEPVNQLYEFIKLKSVLKAFHLPLSVAQFLKYIKDITLGSIVFYANW